MKNAGKILFIGLLLTLSTIAIALAGSDVVNIPISCTIPAIPGMNVPIVNEKDIPAQNKAQTQPNGPGEQPQVTAPVKHREGEMILAEKQTDNKVVKTIYSR